MVAVFAEKGYPVVGLDINPAFVEALSAGRAPVEEPGLQAMIDRNRERIRATTDYDIVIQDSDVTFIIVPTPSGDDQLFSNQYVIESLERIGKSLRKKPGYHCVVVTSTVMPGSTGGEIRATLEAASGRLVGPDLGLCYSPEFIALGSVIRDMLRPDMILIGESDEYAGGILEGIYKNSTESSPQIHRMNFINAELTKIAVNTFVTTKISYANMIADMCDHLPGADAGVVNAAVGTDSRIGRKYLNSGIGYGGPCFPRDNRAFAAFGRMLGARCDLAEATDRINDYQLIRLQGAVEGAAPLGATVAILGLSYKPDSGVIEAAQGVMLAKLLSDNGYRVVAFDPLAGGAASVVLGPAVTIADSAGIAIKQADVVVITTPWAVFKEINRDQLEDGGRQRTVIDPWRILSPQAAEGAARHLVMGRALSEHNSTPRTISDAVS